MLLSFKLSDLPLLNDKKMSKYISTHTHDISQALILTSHLKLKFYNPFHLSPIFRMRRSKQANCINQSGCYKSNR